MTKQRKRVRVIGAGVSGLTTAICLAEAGFGVEVWSAERPEQTTSMAAGAMWGPYNVEPADKVRQWSLETLRVLKKLAKTDGTGVRLVNGLDAARTAGSPPDWAKDLDDFREATPDELPDGFVSGVWYTAPMVDMPVYLRHLENRLSKAGTRIQLRRIDSLESAFDGVDVVINCCGVGAKELVPDPGLTAIRGQLVSVRNPGITEFFTEDTGDSEDLLHLYPHGDSLIIGGVAQPSNWDFAWNPTTADEIVQRAVQIDGRLQSAEVLANRVGLRPTRDKVRVQREAMGAGVALHNYGHGGAGVSLSWGCAENILRMARKVTS